MTGPMPSVDLWANYAALANDAVGATVHQSLAAIAQRHPDRPAVMSDDRHIGFAELVQLVNRVAAWFHGYGLRAGDHVGVSIAQELNNLVATLALLRLGCLQVNIATFNPAPMRAALADRCQLAILVSDDPDQALPGLQNVMVDFDRITGTGEEASTPPLPDPDAEALLWASSGTTGRPKIVPSSQRRFLSYSTRQWLRPGFETSFAATSIQFDITKRRTLNALAMGKATLLVPRANNVPLHVLCHRHSVDMLWISTLQARSMLDAAVRSDQPLLPAQTHMLLGGSTSGTSLREDLMRVASPNLHIAYGSTESGRISVSTLRGRGTDATDVGRLVPTVEVTIKDTDNRALPRGERGEICVRAPGMATKYFRDPELTRRHFRNGRYHTGDIGVLSEDGRLSIEGRKDDMMILNSVNVFPSEIESVIERFPGVVESAAFPLRSPVHGEIPVAMIKTAGDIDLRALGRHCRDHLGVRAPRKLFPVVELSRTAAGKIARNRLAASLDKAVGPDAGPGS